MFLKFLIFGLLTYHVSVDASDIQCPSVDGPDAVYFPHETDCSKFYECSNGVPYLFDCPAGLDFNPDLNVCDYPDQAGCRGRTTSPPTSGTTESSSQNPPVTTTTEATGTETTTILCTTYPTEATTSSSSSSSTSSEAPPTTTILPTEPTDPDDSDDSSSESDESDDSDSSSESDDSSGSDSNSEEDDDSSGSDDSNDSDDGDSGDDDDDDNGSSDSNDSSDNDSSDSDDDSDSSSRSNELLPAQKDDSNILFKLLSGGVEIDPIQGTSCDLNEYIRSMKVHPQLCEKYLKCYNGVTLVKNCAKQYYFDQGIGICVAPGYTKCVEQA